MAVRIETARLEATFATSYVVRTSRFSTMEST
jgi:hypothetical protein